MACECNTPTEVRTFTYGVAGGMNVHYEGCRSVTHIPETPGVTTLSCRRCPNLKTVVIAGSATYAYFYNNPTLCSVATTGETNISVNVHDCPSLSVLVLRPNIVLSLVRCPMILHVPFVPRVDLSLGLQPFTYASRRYGASIAYYAQRTTTEAKVRRWVLRGRVAARARAGLCSAQRNSLLIPPLANIVVAYLATRWK